jgi:hypothetical protein
MGSQQIDTVIQKNNFNNISMIYDIYNINCQHFWNTDILTNCTIIPPPPPKQCYCKYWPLIPVTGHC